MEIFIRSVFEIDMPFNQLQSFFRISGVDPKSVLCAFFKSGKCGKGDKCKFSHDLAVARKSEKRSVYDDGKDGKKGDAAT